MESPRSPTVSPYPTIVRWEEAGASLVTALTNYMGLCLNLGTDSLREGADTKDLVSRVDFTLAVVHTAMSYHLNESKAALARTRNKLASRFFRLPQEVVSEIFANVVFDHNDSASSGRRSLEHDGRMLYRRLYNLLGVCSSWRDLISVRGALWSVIPIFENRSDRKHKAVKRILHRAGGSPLHLAVSMAWSAPRRLTKIIAEHGPRLRTLNVSASGRHVIREAIHNVLQHDPRLSLTELSIWFENPSVVNYRMPGETEYLISRDHSNYASFARLMETLTAFRISGIHVPWETIASSTRLVEVRIEQVAIGYDSAIIPFVRSLSSAPNLRDLKVISVSTFHDLGATQGHNSSAPVTFPNLETLLLQDLYYNTLEHLLPVVSPGSYHLTLFLTRKSLETNMIRDAPGDEEEEEDRELVDISELGSALTQARVDTLMISGNWGECWLTGPEIRALLISVPAVKTLKISGWDLDHSIWRALRRSPAARRHPEDHRFPVFENLHFSCVKIINQRGLKNMITSHPIQGMVLGAIFSDITDELSEWSCDEDDGIVQWLKVNIPVLHLLNSTHRPPEFHLDVWQLW
ncbi:hypothetical protein RSOLAG22IIIB_08777 [Rhizoctonia solani]|uniref:F-box domain-containing protein n=1 Tax=Rhizoctonia solani TaxID=456999 RepID=A0A0K6FV07_9AGAM|nr:hypothetical protein RSOLAG22IIIB_08777 [Rhizoctonia solani]